MIWEKRGGVAYSTVTEAILTASGLSEEELLHPTPNSHVTLDGLQQAAEVILRARNEGRSAVIIGDYDVDGITSTAVLSMLFSFLRIRHTTIIPKRFTEGYGVSTAHIEDVSDALIVMVDNGISAGSILTDARKERGNYVVVVDHHLPDASVPEVDAIIDPHYYNSGGFMHYCGAGLAYQLAMYMISEDVAPETLCNDLLILAAVGTVADSMPLIGDNRLIVSKALAVANNRFAPMSAGLRCLLDACGDPGTLRANTLSYKLSPMLNAPGRLYDSGGSSVLKALLCKDQELGNSYVTKMVAINQDRKRMVEAYLSLACDSAQGQSSPIVVYLPGLLEGLLGVVAGRLIGTFNSTVVVLSDSRDGKAIKGSVRAVPGDNAKELLDSVRNLLTVYGGHSGAAGMTLERANLDAFTDALKEMRSSHSVCSNLLYDVELSQETVFRSMRALNRFEPLGHGVPNPVCVIRNVEVQDVAYMGQDKNTVKLVCDGFSILGFGKAELYRKHNEPRTLDVIGTLSENHFRGRTTIQVVAEDFHPCIF